MPMGASFEFLALFTKFCPIVKSVSGTQSGPYEKLWEDLSKAEKNSIWECNGREIAKFILKETVEPLNVNPLLIEKLSCF